MLDTAGLVLVALGCLFFMAGTVGLIRLPDVLSRLHALTKADNLGLGLVALGLALQADSGFVAAKLLLVWVFMAYAGSLASVFVAGAVRRTAERTDGEP